MNQEVDDIDLEMTKDADPFKIPRRRSRSHPRVDLAPRGQKWFPVGALPRSARPLRRAHRRRRVERVRRRQVRLGDLLHRQAHRRCSTSSSTCRRRSHDHHRHQRYGDGFMEHGYINHGNALYQDLLTSRCWSTCGNQPRANRHRGGVGARSGADRRRLVRIDVSNLPMEGKSLVPRSSTARPTPIASSSPRPTAQAAALRDQPRVEADLRSRRQPLRALRPGRRSRREEQPDRVAPRSVREDEGRDGRVHGARRVRAQRGGRTR